jgi:hypothetical protein
MAYGQNKAIGEWLYREVGKAKECRRRSTQTISLLQLANIYGFKIYAVSKTPEELFAIFQLKGNCKKIRKEHILSIESFEG